MNVLDGHHRFTSSEQRLSPPAHDENLEIRKLPVTPFLSSNEGVELSPAVRC